MRILFLFGIGAFLTLTATAQQDSTLVQVDDMLLPSEAFAAQKGASPALAIRPWTNGIVRYEIDDGVNAALAERCREAIAILEAKTSIRFIEQRNGALRIIQGNKNVSPLGMLGIQQQLTVNYHASTGIILHELSHALGRIHEHQRVDRDDYIEVFPENAQPDLRDAIRAKLDVPLFTGYDLLSLMHYGPSQGAVTGFTILPRPEYEQYMHQIGQRDSLTWRDIAYLNALYSPVPQRLAVSDIRATTATLAWTTVHQTAAHEVQIATDEAFTDVIVNTLIPSSDGTRYKVYWARYEATGLPPLRRLFWRVRGRDDHNSLPWSPPLGFETLPSTSETRWLFPAYPNPFPDATEVAVEVTTAMPVRLAIYDALGRQVALLADEEIPAGYHTWTWNADGLATGMYLLRLETPAGVQSRSLLKLP